MGCASLVHAYPHRNARICLHNTWRMEAHVNNIVQDLPFIVTGEGPRVNIMYMRANGDK